MKYACDVTFKKEETSFNRNQLLPIFDLMTVEKRVGGILGAFNFANGGEC